MRRRVVVPVVAAVLVLVAAGLVGWRAFAPRSTYTQAIEALPASTLRASYTDWQQVRSLAGGTTLGPASTGGQIGAFLRRAYDRGLTSASALTGSVSAMERVYGFSPVSALWESYGQSRQGSVDVLRMPDGTDFDSIEQDLRTLGYRSPRSGIGTGGVWRGSANLVAHISPGLTPVQQNVVVLASQGVVLLSDSASYAASAAAVVRGNAPTLESPLTSVAGSPVSAVLWARDFACADLSMGSASAEDQRIGSRLVSRAGGINPLSGLVMALQPPAGSSGGSSGGGLPGSASASGRTTFEMTVGMEFEDSDQASENLQPRVDLASGPAPGQGGTFPGRFKITSAQASGSSVVLQLQPRPGEQLLSDLSEGPVLFATC